MRKPMGGDRGGSGSRLGGARARVLRVRSRAGLLPALLLVGLVGATGCASPLDLAWTGLEQAERRWAENAPDHYAFTYQDICYCALQIIHSEVRDGVVVAAEWGGADEDPGPESGPEPEGYTVEDLFERIRKELERDPFEATTHFDPVLGYPTRVFFDYQENTIDEEWGFRVEGFTVLP